MAAPPALGRRKREAAVLALFDVDDTLTAPRKAVTPEMLEFMKQLRQHVTLGVVGGSDLLKITEQLGESVFTDYEHVFSENGLVAHKNGKLIGAQVRLLGTTSYISLKSFLLEKTSSRYCVHFLALLLSIYKALGLADDEMLHSVQEIINFALRYIADLDIPIKRSMKNLFSSYGRNCSQEERDEFEKYDKFFPQGWDKTYCLKYLEEFQEIHFFGDKTYKGGNDYEIFVSDRTVGHTVTSPVDTLQQCRSLFMSK
ncbi:hypothetical protein U9M48_030454 [Paspalum notatum var. saurae]|uniref:Phosphomannomutase n=1 Tax=Paspalum notatum var. saurae TaxID=547442 RepID=A0AAQ3X399_PASNO